MLSSKALFKFLAPKLWASSITNKIFPFKDFICFCKKLLENVAFVVTIQKSLKDLNYNFL